MFGQDHPPVRIICIGGVTLAAFIDDAGDEGREAGVLVEIFAIRGVGIGYGQQIVIRVVSVGVNLAVWIGQGLNAAR
jgi:hypothetical protein